MFHAKRERVSIAIGFESAFFTNSWLCAFSSPSFPPSLPPSLSHALFQNLVNFPGEVDQGGGEHSEMS